MNEQRRVTRRTHRLATAGFRVEARTLDGTPDEVAQQARAITAAVTADVEARRDGSTEETVAQRIAALPFVVEVEVTNGLKQAGVLIVGAASATDRG
jgi:hypothetical protein